MTTRDFIAKTYGITSNRDRHCSSVFTDYNGNVYSYGYHYPLLFKVAGTTFINTRGYSSSTAKHIAWAQSAVGYGNYVKVELNRDDARVISASYTSDQDKLFVLARATAEMVANATEARDAKKRTDTQVYEHLTNVLEQAWASRLAVDTLREAQ